MNKQMGKLLALLLVTVVMLSGCNLIKVNKEVDDQTVVAEYTGGKILKGEAMAQYDEVVSYYESYGQSLTDAATITSIKQDLLDYMVEEAVVRLKADELGLTAMTDDEKADLTAEITASYNEAIEYYTVYFDEGSEEANRQAAVDYLAEQGYVLEGEIQYAIENAWVDKMFEHVTKDVAPTEEEIRAAYDSMVASDQEAYSASPYDFEYAATSGETVAWVPEGYRTVKHILLSFTDEQIEKMDDLVIELEDVRYQLEGSPEEGDLPLEEHYEGDGHVHTEDELLLESDGAAEDAAETLGEAPAAEGEAALMVEQEPADAPDEDFEEEPVLSEAELKAKEAELTAKLDALKAEFAKTLEAKVAEIQGKIASGADFDQLIAEYGEDEGMKMEPGLSEGYYVSANSEMWEDEFTKAAMALQKVGDVSQPVIGSSGIHIIRYMSDVAAGPVPFEKLKARAEEAALDAAKDTHYEETVAQWVSEANVKTYVDKMK